MVRFPGSNTPGMEPVVRVNMHSSGKYAFIEFRSVPGPAWVGGWYGYGYGSLGIDLDLDQD
jgi:hypothetical protein